MSKDTQMLELAMTRAEEAQSAYDKGFYFAVCVSGEAVFYLEHDHALIPGHIYSSDGVREFQISRCCEFHFDEWFKEPDDNVQDWPL